MADETSLKPKKSSFAGRLSVEVTSSLATIDGNNNANASQLTAATTSPCRQRTSSNGSNLNVSSSEVGECFDATRTPQSETTTTAGSESDDWQLLNIEEHPSSSEESCASSALESVSRKKAKRADTSKMKLISIDDTIDLKRSSGAIRLACAVYSLLPLASLLTLILLIALAFSRFWLVPACYFGYMILDKNSCNKGGRRIDFVYRARFWSYLAAYFPIRIRHSDKFELDSDENYILNYHPHGISAFGCVTAFATNGLNFAKLFPKITARFMVHEKSFSVPLMRETFLFRGDCSVNSKSFDYILAQKAQTGRAGNLLALVGGGLAEADQSDAQVLKIVVATRKGFVKKALVHGANLIPCIAFGENSVFNKVNLKPGSLLDRLQTSWYDLFKFKHPIYYGTSLFGSKWRGAMPYKRPITLVLGDPIEVQRTESPSQEDIDRLHSEYLSSLQRLYRSNSDLHTRFDTELELV